MIILGIICLGTGTDVQHWTWILVGAVLGVILALVGIARWAVRDAPPFGYWDN